MTPSDALAEQTVMLGVALETRGAEDATGRLARLRERTVALPAVARPAVELALAENPADTEQILSAVTDPAALPAQTLQAWVETPPAFLGTPDAPAHAAAWALLGEIAAAYGLHGHAGTAFERAVSAGSARRPYLLARAAWSAMQAGDVARAASIAPPASLAPYAEAAYASDRRLHCASRRDRARRRPAAASRATASRSGGLEPGTPGRPRHAGADHRRDRDERSVGLGESQARCRTPDP